MLLGEKGSYEKKVPRRKRFPVFADRISKSPNIQCEEPQTKKPKPKQRLRRRQRRHSDHNHITLQARSRGLRSRDPKDSGGIAPILVNARPTASFQVPNRPRGLDLQELRC